MRQEKFKKTKTILSLFLIAIVIALTATVAVNAPSSKVAVAATKPTISKKTRNILVGKKYNLNINNKVAKSKYKWTSSNEKIATVDSRGIVTAKSKGVVDIVCKITTPDKKEYKVSCKVTVREPAMVFRIRNKVSALNLGQEYDLNRIIGPSSSNDKTTWTTSDASIAKPDSMGRFTALKEGKVTITGSTMSGKSDSVTINVVDEAGTVTNQVELDALIGSGAELITIKTDAELELKIKSGKYLGQTLVVDAPNSDIINYGVFKSIEIKQVKNDTWYERAVGNLLKILDKEMSINIAIFASASLEVNVDKAVLRIENNGIIKEIVINKEAELVIQGDSKKDAPVIINNPNIKIKTSAPLNIVSKAKFELEILPGAEKTTIKASSKDTVPTIKGIANIKVEIEGEEVDVEGTAPTPTPVPGGGGGGYIPPTPGGDDPDPVPTGRVINLLSGKKLADVNTVIVKFVPFNLNYTISTDMMDTLIGFLNNQSATVTNWLETTNTTKTYNGVEVNVSGTANSKTKTVAFSASSPIGAKSFDVTVNSESNSVTIKYGVDNSFTITKLNDSSISISPELSKDVLDFTFTYR